MHKKKGLNYIHLMNFQCLNIQSAVVVINTWNRIHRPDVPISCKG